MSSHLYFAWDIEIPEHACYNCIKLVADSAIENFYVVPEKESG